MNPLRHYVEFGGAEGRDPHPLFDSRHYLATYLNGTNERHNPLVHYLTIGWRLGYQPNRQFDPGLVSSRPSGRSRGRHRAFHALHSFRQKGGKNLTRRRDFLQGASARFRSSPRTGPPS